MFLIDLARFTQIYNRTLSLHDSKCEVLTGLELSLKSLEKLLDKEKVEWIGKKDDPFDHELHERV
jgi:molecular chaperone GrpE (heat shock protein)